MRKKSNKRIGNEAENSLVEILKSKGYFVHRLKENQNGQPFDIIAIKNNKALCIECKYCSGDKFNFSRIEENQKYSNRVLKKVNSDLYAAISFNDCSLFYLVEMDKLINISNNKRYIREEDLNGYYFRKLYIN